MQPTPENSSGIKPIEAIAEQLQKSGQTIEQFLGAIRDNIFFQSSTSEVV